MGEPGHTVGSLATARPLHPEVRVAATSTPAPVTEIGTARVTDRCSVEAAVDALADRRPVLVTNDRGEVSMMAVAAAADVTVLAFMVRHTSGFVCVALPEADCDRLGLPPMQARGANGGHADFRVTVDAACGVGTGISARDRARTAALLADPASGPADFSRPGHVVPLATRTGGVLERPGDAEAGVDLAMLAGFAPAAVLARMVSPATSVRMATDHEVVGFGAEWGMPIVQVSALKTYRAARRPPATRMADTALPMSAGTGRAVGYRGADGSEYLVLVVGSVADGYAVPVYVHHECLLGDVFGSLRCACGHRLDRARRAILNGGLGVLIYRRGGSSGASWCARGEHPHSAGRGVPGPDADVVPEQILRDLGVLSMVPCISADADGEPSPGPQRVSGFYLVGGP
jgi:3,4-dihydroxy 2-butanone 4-phosphate synthase/GTP cyclohydrolase II